MQQQPVRKRPCSLSLASKLPIIAGSGHSLLSAQAVLQFSLSESSKACFITHHPNLELYPGHHISKYLPYIKESMAVVSTHRHNAQWYPRKSFQQQELQHWKTAMRCLLAEPCAEEGVTHRCGLRRYFLTAQQHQDSGTHSSAGRAF